MEPGKAWGAFSIIIILADAIFAGTMIDLGYEPVLVGAVALVVLLFYFYILYKRYHVEVVPERDIMQFEDPDDLRMLCSIYGLNTEGDETELRNRLSAFAKAHRDKALVWVAPRLVKSFGSALEIPQNPEATKAAHRRPLLGESKMEKRVSSEEADGARRKPRY